MSKLRRLLVPLAAMWLSVHVAGVTGPTIAALAFGDAPAEIVCTCAHGSDHGSCPMHRSPAASTECQMRATQDDLGSALMAMPGPLSVPVASDLGLVETPSSGLIAYASPFPSNWNVPPDPPPPRG